MFDFGIGCVGVRIKGSAWDILTFLCTFKRAGRIRLYIKDMITDPAVLALCILNCLPKGLQLKKTLFSTETHHDLLSFRGIHSPCVLLSLDFSHMHPVSVIFTSGANVYIVLMKPLSLSLCAS